MTKKIIFGHFYYVCTGVIFKDLDWEYPANRDTENRPEDQIYFTTLCKVSIFI